MQGRAKISFRSSRTPACSVHTRVNALALATMTLSALLSGAVIFDRIAVIAGTHVIKTSDITRDIRLTDFLNRVPLNFTASVKRDAAERLITQQLIRDEIVSGGYRRAPESEAVEFEGELRRDRFGGSEQRLVEELQHYGLTRAQLREQLIWQITVLQFIDERFRGGIVVTDEDIRGYYDQHAAELQRQAPKDASLAALTPKIRTLLEGERVNKAFDEWLDQGRKNYRVEFKPGAFEQEDSK
jgi:peptidyl-prolyl cis-trans isomerase SurA